MTITGVRSNLSLRARITWRALGRQRAKRSSALGWR